MSLFYCFDINVFSIDYAQWEMCNVWRLLFKDNSRSITIQELHWRNNIVAVITNIAYLDTYRLFPILPTLFLQYSYIEK